MLTLYDFLRQGYVDDMVDVNIFYVEADGSIDHEDNDIEDIKPYYNGWVMNIPYYLLDCHLLSHEMQLKADVEGAIRPMGGGEHGLNIFVED